MNSEPVSCLEYIDSAERVFSKPGLERVKYLLKSAGDPHKKLKYVHIAGTNGKGSVALMIHGILKSAGYRTGLYSSPDVSGRFDGLRINNANITEAVLDRLFAKFRKACDELDGEGDPPTAFEIMTACAFLWFYEEKCDIAVVECGMGGKLDATNVIPKPEVAVLTSICLDHTKVLGDTVAKIAANKAGIIKKGTRVVFYGEEEDALPVIREVCARKNVPLAVPDFGGIGVRVLDKDRTVIDYKEFSGLSVGMRGIQQIKNACCAVEAAKMLREAGFSIDDNSIRKGISSAKAPGRFEIFKGSKLIIYDGAHNPGGLEALADNLGVYFPGKKFTVIAGFMADKDHRTGLEILKPYIGKMYAVRPDNKRALDADALALEAKQLGIETETASICDGIIEKTALKASKDDITLICGSLYLYAEALPHIMNAINHGDRNMDNGIITIAVDGPSGAGKSTIAKAIAKRFKIGYLDTGAMYRTVALYMDRMIPELSGEVENGAILPGTTAKIVELLSGADISVVYDEKGVQHMYLGKEDVSGIIRTPLISMEASKVSAIPEVRVFLVEMQRSIGSKNSIIMDGRDIGTHVLKNAAVKIFLTATPEERARRRYLELKEKGTETDYETVLKEVIERDYGDSHRAASPLMQAEDAVLLDTTELNLSASIEAAVAIVSERTGIYPDRT